MAPLHTPAGVCLSKPELSLGKKQSPKETEHRTGEFGQDGKEWKDPALGTLPANDRLGQILRELLIAWRLGASNRGSERDLKREPLRSCVKISWVRRSASCYATKSSRE